ncbi:MAG: 6-phosphogluconolactonase [Phycisphaerales bacterium]|nr:6-phosphogluconolactonase [Phycisphaerales bacterium]
MSDSAAAQPESDEPYAVEESTLVAPALPGKVHLSASRFEAYDALMADLIIHASQCVRQFGDFHLALSGGSTPMPFYEQLMTDPRARGFPWARTHLWMVDERCVPFDHEKSNWRQIQEILVEASDIPKEQVHPMLAYLPDADVRYEKELRDTLSWREKGHDRLDFVLLGMGDEGHTASLFPHSIAQDATDRLVVFNRGASVVPPDRLTMTYGLLNASRCIAPLVLGAGKAQMLARIAKRTDDFHEIPILGIAPLAGELKWYLDHASAGGTNET